MSPPTVVLNREFIDIPENCPVMKLVQNECDFNRATGKYKCEPLPRLYRVCETPTGKRHYEVTNLASIDIITATKEMLEMSKSDH